MATLAGTSERGPVQSLAPDLIERVIAAGAALMLALLLAAVARGHSQWRDVPALVWLHLGTIAVALAITPAMMLRRRGDRLHRRLGWVWAAAMFATALISLGVRTIRPGHFSLVHLFSVMTLVSVPLILVTARRHKVARHRRTVRGLLIGGLMVAGFFTLVPSRLLGHWLLG